MTTFGAMGVWVLFIAFATSKWGGDAGGFLIGIPSTLGLSLYFTGWYVSAAIAVEATNELPLFLSFIGLYLLAFGYLAKRSFLAGILGGLLVWFAPSLLVFYSGLSGFWPSLAAGLAIFSATYYIFRKRLRPAMSKGGGASSVGIPLNLLRFLIGGGVVTIAVYFGQIDIPVLSAMASSFPALSLSALIAVQVGSRDQGTSRTRGLTMPATVSIMFMLVPFAVIVHFLYPVVGVVYGTAMAYAVVGVIALVYYKRGRRYLLPDLGEPAHESSANGGTCQRFSREVECIGSGHLRWRR